MLIVLPLVIQNLKAALIGSGGDDTRIDAVDPNPGRPVECPDYPVDLGFAALKFHGYRAEPVVSDPAGVTPTAFVACTARQRKPTP